MLHDIKNNRRNIELFTWNKVRDQVYKVNEELAILIDSISPDNSFKFVKIDYLFGDAFVDKGIFQLPHGDDLVPITSSEINAEIKKELFYKNNPLFLTLSKGNEVFMDTDQRIIPLNYYRSGSICCTYKTCLASG